jgi:hypothetical protein
VLVIPGGFAPDFIRRSEAMLKFTRAMAEHGKILAAICHGPWVLCSTTALRGKRATCFHAIKDDVINAGAKYEDAEVIRDGNLITSRKPDDLPAFMQAIQKIVTGEPAQGVKGKPMAPEWLIDRISKPASGNGALANEDESFPPDLITQASAVTRITCPETKAAPLVAVPPRTMTFGSVTPGR